MGRATISDVAQRAGVSPTAVSFTFNNPSQLSAATVSRVKEAARELGYAPNPHARALFSKRAGIVGVLVPQGVYETFANPFFSAFLQGVGAVCDIQGLSLMTVSPLEGSLERAITNAPVDGFIVLGINEYHREVAPLAKRDIPYVIVDGDADVAPSVNVDDAGGAYRAADSLLSRGHRDLLILTFPPPPGEPDEPYYGVGARREEGYARAFEERGLSLDGARILPSPYTGEGGVESLAVIWEAGHRPTAVLTVSDGLAFGVLKAARSQGVRVPEDLEVIGFDDVPFSELSQPPLSTVRQPIIEKGREAARVLTDTLGGRPGESTMLPTELVLRGTTQ